MKLGASLQVDPCDQITKHLGDRVYVLSRTGAWRPGTPANSPGHPSGRAWVWIKVGPLVVVPWWHGYMAQCLGLNSAERLRATLYLNV